MGRPGYLQRWGYAASVGALVQPPDGSAGAGFSTAQRPPAQWFNWCFANWADWINFLRGANHEHWTRTAWGTSPSTFDANLPLFLAVDTETADAVGAAYRYVIAGQETGTPNTAALRVSQRGNAWTRLTNVTATSSAVPCALAYVPNPAASGSWLLGCDDASINYCAADAGGGTGPVGSGSGNWSVSSTPGGMTDVVAFAVKEATKIFALTVDGGVQSTDQGITWTAYAGTSGTARSGNGSDACWTGNAFLFVTTDGQIYKSATVGGVFAYVTDLGGTATWQLATDGDGGVLAYRVNSGSLLDIFWSADDGATWETITPTAGFLRIQRVRHHAGTWLACSTVAPFLWSSNDHETWRKLRMPVGTDAALYDIAWDGGAWICAGNGFVIQCPRGHDPGDADDAWSPGASSAPLVDAGYLRGVEVSSTAPTSGQTLVYNSTGGVWEPSSAGASPTTTRGDLIRRGASADERFAALTANTFVGGDGTDVTVRTVAQTRTSLKTGSAGSSVAGASFTGANGVGTATASTLTLTTASTASTWSDIPRLLYDHGGDPWNITVTARLAACTGGDGNTFPSLALRNSAGDNLLLVQARGSDGLVSVYGNSGGDVSSGAVTMPFDGTGAFRIVLREGVATVYQSTDSGTSWRPIYRGNPPIPSSSPWAYTRASFALYQGGAPGGTVTVQWADVTVGATL